MPGLPPADLAVAVLVLIALITDLSSRRIPNLLSLGFLALGLAANGLAGDVAVGFIGAGVAFAMMFPGWLMGRAIRAGDAKLLMAVGAFYGGGDALRACLFSYILHLPYGLAVLLVKGRLGNLVATVRAGVGRAMGREIPEPELTEVPFMPVIAVAVLLTRATDWLVFW